MESKLNKGITENKSLETNNNSETKGIFKIKPETKLSRADEEKFKEQLFDLKSSDYKNNEINAIELKDQLIKELTDNSDYPETINKEVDLSECKTLSTVENRSSREAFDKNKNQLKKEWADKNEQSWPKYESDVIIKDRNGNDKVIRKAGMDYDVHHIVPLKINGENVVDNITPLHCLNHQEVHKVDGACDKLVKTIGGNGYGN